MQGSDSDRYSVASPPGHRRAADLTKVLLLCRVILTCLPSHRTETALACFSVKPGEKKGDTCRAVKCRHLI